MFRKILAGVVLTVGLLGMAGSAYAEDSDYPTSVVFSAGSPGLFCKVQDPDVCVIAQSEEDCTKLGGVKADSCPMPEKEGE